jgi:catechol 2,3-dioxygenase-like lactoylglutathione lyase family enzyme
VSLFLSSLFSLFAKSVIHNSFPLKRLRTLSKNSRVYPNNSHSETYRRARGFAMNRKSVSMQREDPMAIDIRGMAPLFQVFDMPTSVKFYRDVLGFEVVTTSTPRGEHFDWALLRLHGVELMLNTAFEEDARPPAPDPARFAMHEDTCLYFGCPDVDAAYAYLRARGVAAKEPEVAPYGMKQLYVSDPDGYNLCFQWPAK